MKYLQLFKLLLASSILLPLTVLAQTAPIPATVSASTQSGNSRSAAKAIDGDTATRWEASNSSPGSWLALHFSEPQTLSQVNVSEYGSRIQAYEYQVLRNGVWTTVASGSSPSVGLRGQHLESVSAVRLYVTKAGAQPSIIEMRAYKTATSVGACTIYNGTPETVIQGVVDCGGARVSGPHCRDLPLFRLAPDATMKNVHISTGQVQCEGSCRLERVSWSGVPCRYTPSSLAAFVGSTSQPVMEVVDGSAAALTSWATSSSSSSSGSGITPYFVPFGIRHQGTIKLRNFTFFDLQSLNLSPPVGGGSQTPPSWPGTMNFDLENVRIHKLTGALAHMGNLRARNVSIGGYQPGAPVICAGYVRTHYTGWHAPTGEQWNTAQCDVSPSDIIALPTN